MHVGASHFKPNISGYYHNILFEGGQIFSSFMQGQQLLPYFERMIKNSDKVIQSRLVPCMTNTLQVVQKTLKDIDILHRRCYWYEYLFRNF